MIHPPPPPRVFVVASAVEIRAVLAVLRTHETPHTPGCVLLSPADAGCFMGPAWWHALLAETGFTFPAFLDCGTAAGRAAEALGLGLRHIVLHGTGRQADTINLLARSLDATCLHHRPPHCVVGPAPSPERLRACLFDTDHPPIRP
ncbi:hypothetical protein GLI01_00800 [Gluconacetobacter liquefaciens]|uniref:Uncharacterized protein n=1 Tax=Gluconacetobacter liquefaciens TaxID=89584 RepID=A0A370GAB7_GLULI|nr:hypothetical protein [Gluconacetobacter liquefaciens]RDI39404.1 hypothetical protein C7453_102191 [Gluconacetobacter liquefaciens]GEB36045.1 hypothetical protein GLI01_00800 [Gluconacetobacter liquefaciens]